MPHYKSLDGLRGVAVLLVMLFHLHVTGMSLGWSGVPLFFVLSGFLITGILIEEKEKPALRYFGAFFVKRLLRIFPLYYLYLVLTAIYFYRSITPDHWWFVFYLQNYFIGNHPGSSPQILPHTWSLAIEEQFYFIWPVVVYFLSRRAIAAVCMLLIATAPIVRWYILSKTGNPYMTIVSLPSCMDMLACGALFALTKDMKEAKSLAVVFLIAGLIMLYFAISNSGMESFWVTSKWKAVSSYTYTAFAFIFGSIIYLLTTKSLSFTSVLLCSKPMVFIGKISYGLYIWHLLCYYVVEHLAARVHFLKIPGVSAIASLGISFVVATLSYYLFEVHFLKLKNAVFGVNSTLKKRALGQYSTQNH